MAKLDSVDKNAVTPDKDRAIAAIDILSRLPNIGSTKQAAIVLANQIDKILSRSRFTALLIGDLLMSFP